MLSIPRTLAPAFVLIALSAAPCPAWAERPAAVARASGVIGVHDAQLRPEYWIGRLEQPDRALMSRAAIDEQNARLLRLDPSMHELEALPDTLSRERVAGWIGKLSRRPSRALHFADGRVVTPDWLDGLQSALALEAIPAQAPARFGLVVRRASLRAFPDSTRVVSDPSELDIDRFQESALFPGTPVQVAHRSRDGRWLFVVAPNYAAWIEADAVAAGTRAEVLGFAKRRPHRVITGARAETVYTPEEPRVSGLSLDMGTRLPLALVPAGQPVNGQNPYTAWPLLLPVRNADGSLAFAPALLPKVADSAADPLPYTQANLLRQAFKFLGERYGWGHDYEGRDCSGFVAEVYRSLGIELPRNTGDQVASPVLSQRQAFGPTDARAVREAALAAAQPGDLIYIPGHMMMVLGHVDGALYVIHDIQGGSWLDAGGQLRRMHLNGVSVTPFAPLRFDEASDYTDRMTQILRIR